MPTICSAFIATSLDGYIARSDGSIDWLDDANRSVPPGEDCGFAAFMADVELLAMGRNTFEQLLSFDSWPYGATPVVVLSQRGVTLPAHLPPCVSVSSETPEALVARLRQQGVKKIYVDGGRTIQSFLAAGLIGEITITVIPILLGNGKPLFGPLPTDLHCHLEHSIAFDFGFVQSRYRVIRS